MPPTDRLKALDARITALKSAHTPRSAQTQDYHSQAHLAWRMVIELVAGLAIGVGIGIGVDALLGTQPWAMIAFTLLGFIAGIKTMLRSAKHMNSNPSNTQSFQPPAAEV